MIEDMSSDERPPELDGSGYTRSSDRKDAKWAVPANESWTITARVNAAGIAWFEEAVTLDNQGLEIAPGAMVVKV